MQLIEPTLPHTIRVILMLTEGLHNKGYDDLYVDRFYSSPLLAKCLTDIGISVTGKKSI